jgi:hypothetical protein
LHEPLSTSILSLAAVREVHLTPAINSIVVCYDPQNITEKAFQEKFCHLLQQLTPEVGGKLIGSSVGRVMGFGVGAVAGGVLLGPLGLIPGAGVGSAVGGTVGSQLGGETVRYLSGTGAEAQRWPVPAKNPAESLQATLERGATELIGETFNRHGRLCGGWLSARAR